MWQTKFQEIDYSKPDPDGNSEIHAEKICRHKMSIDWAKNDVLRLFTNTESKNACSYEI